MGFLNENGVHIDTPESLCFTFKCQDCGKNKLKENWKLCDFVLEDGKTCDRNICTDCSTVMGEKNNDTVDYCKSHACKPIQMTHSDLVTIGARYLRYQNNCSIVIEEPASAYFVKPDVMGFQMYSSFMIEVKISRSDFLADKRKKHAGDVIANRNYYLVPTGLIAPEDIKNGYGLIYAPNNRWQDLEVVKECELQKEVNEWVHKRIFHGLLNKHNIKGHFKSDGQKANKK